MSDKEEWIILPHREVKKNDIPLLEQLGLKSDFDEIVDILKKNPYQQVRNMEVLQPRQKKIYSMRINLQHRVVYTVDKENKIVKIWSAWTQNAQTIKIST